MIKLSASRKKFILELFAVLVVCAFLAISLVPSIRHSGTGANTKPIYDVYSSPLLSNRNNSSSAGYVKCTPVLLNNTLVNGNFINTENGREPYDATFDSSDGYMYVANYNSGTISIIVTQATTSVSKYTVTFTETGLPSGTSWSVCLTAQVNHPHPAK